MPLMSGVYGVIGKQRSGKSYTCTKLTLGELLDGSRYVVTNVSLDLAELAGFVGEEGYPANIIRQRVRLLTPEEAFLFWRFRGPGVELIPERTSIERDGKKVESLKFPPINDFGVLWIVDEANLILSSRRWDKMGEECETFLQQVAKQHDVLLLVTHVPKNIDRYARDQVMEWWDLKNFGRTRFRGIRGPKKFWCRMYQEPPSANSVMVGESFYSLDPRIAKCYHTEQGVGTSSTLADKDERPAGVHWSVAVAVACCFLLFIAGCCHTVWQKVRHKTVGSLDSLGKTSMTSAPVAVSKSVSTNVVPMVRRIPFRVPAAGGVIDWYSQTGDDFTFHVVGEGNLHNPQGRWNGQRLELADGRVYEYRSPGR